MGTFPKWLPFRIVGVLGCAGAILSGCVTTPSPSDEAVDLLTGSGSYHEGQYFLTVAEQELIGNCMSEQDQPYPVAIPERPEGTGAELEVGMASRRREGYGLDRAGARPASELLLGELSETDRTAYLVALEGGPRDRRGLLLGNGSTVTFASGGCQGRAWRRLYGDPMEWARLTYAPQAMNTALARQVATDPRYRSAIRAWSTCMAGRGHQVSDPEAAQAALREAYQAGGDDEALRRREIDTAVADGECSMEVGLPALVREVKHELAETLPEADRTELALLTESWRTAVATARTIVD